MASQSEPPYAQQDPHEISTLVKGLKACVGKGKSSKKQFSLKKSTFVIPGTGGAAVDSWRFQDWDYKRRDLPTYARGLFTTRRKDGTPEIVIRGYDKFFNQGETHDTKWEDVESRTKGPYELSVKENGCIIFISGLEDETLLVCSKHSTGARQDADLSHAIAGEKWVDKHMAAVGKTRHDLARELRKRNVTAVAELCDDTFEEHVLAYDEKSAGLYLHGINLNLPEFATYPGPLVHQFADEWGFKKAEFLIKEDIQTVKVFLEACAETGSWNGRDTEGFVIRCQRHVGGNTGPLQNWFFKYKFEEPYLMYRQWREATKAVIRGKSPKVRKHKKITDEYLLYARRRLAKNPELGKAYNENHGIIAMRNGFLEDRGLKGSDIIQQELENGEEGLDSVTKNVILVPIATIGCGKTTVALALTKLFGWGHIQNDNITGKSNRPKQFTTQVCNSLAAHPAVIADRNNHQFRERKQIIQDVQQIIPDACFVALHYVHEPRNWQSIRKVTQQRVLDRGDNHQTIQAVSKGEQEILGIMEGFLKRFEPCQPEKEPDSNFDEIISLDVEASSRKNLEHVIQTLHSTYPNLVKEVPPPQVLDACIASALTDYKPDMKHDLSFGKDKTTDETKNKAKDPKPKEPKLEYFCVRLPTVSVLSTLNDLFSSLDATAAKFYRQLQQSRRVQPSFHVTLIHRASSTSHPDLWARMTSLHSNALHSDAEANAPSIPREPSLGKCGVKLERVIWDSRVMCIVARLVDEGWETVNAVAHVTVGTAAEAIKPKESNDLLGKWLKNGSGGETGVSELLIESEKTEVLEGNVIGVWQSR